MAKESMKAREVKRQRMVAKYAEKKAALKKAALADAEGTFVYGISRIQFREMASAGLIPGVKKASW